MEKFMAIFFSRNIIFLDGRASGTRTRTYSTRSAASDRTAAILLCCISRTRLFPIVYAFFSLLFARRFIKPSARFSFKLFHLRI